MLHGNGCGRMMDNASRMKLIAVLHKCNSHHHPLQSILYTLYIECKALTKSLNTDNFPIDERNLSELFITISFILNRNFTNHNPEIKNHLSNVIY